MICTKKHSFFSIITDGAAAALATLITWKRMKRMAWSQSTPKVWATTRKVITSSPGTCHTKSMTKVSVSRPPVGTAMILVNRWGTASNAHGPHAMTTFILLKSLWIIYNKNYASTRQIWLCQELVTGQCLCTIWLERSLIFLRGGYWSMDSQSLGTWTNLAQLKTLTCWLYMGGKTLWFRLLAELMAITSGFTNQLIVWFKSGPSLRAVICSHTSELKLLGMIPSLTPIRVDTIWNASSTPRNAKVELWDANMMVNMGMISHTMENLVTGSLKKWRMTLKIVKSN